jgi:hypothetical protein
MGLAAVGAGYYLWVNSTATQSLGDMLSEGASGGVSVMRCARSLVASAAGSAADWIESVVEADLPRDGMFD